MSSEAAEKLTSLEEPLERMWKTAGICTATGAIMAGAKGSCHGGRSLIYGSHTVGAEATDESEKMDIAAIINGMLGWLSQEGSWVVVGAVATALFTGWAVIQRSARTPRPHWEFEDMYFDEPSDGTRLDLAEGTQHWAAFVFMNSGDAPAWRVTIQGALRHPRRYRQVFRTVRVLPGETIEYRAPGTVHEKDLFSKKLMGGDGIWLDTHGALIRITWHHRPGWWMQRKTRRSLDRIQRGHTYQVRPGPTPITSPASYPAESATHADLSAPSGT